MLTGRFDASSPRTVHYKQAADSNEQQFVMFWADTDPRQLSAAPAQAISPLGLNGSRQTYLYQHIPDFVADPWKYVMCPRRPGTVFPISSGEQPNDCKVVSNSDDDCAAGHADASDKKRWVTVNNRKSDKTVWQRGRVSSQRKWFYWF